MSAFTEEHTFLPLSTIFSKSIPTSVYQTFPNSIKLGGARSSNAYSILENKSWKFLWQFMLFTRTIYRHISTRP